MLIHCAVQLKNIIFKSWVNHLNQVGLNCANNERKKEMWMDVCNIM